MTRRLPEKKSLDRAGRGARGEPRARRETRASSRKREKNAPPRDTTIERAEAGNKIEQGKMKKDPTNAWTDLYDFAAKIRAGSLYYSDFEDFDVNSRLKWTGMLSRFKRTPGRFMMRLRTPNGVVKSDTLRLFADTIEPYGDDLGVMDITTRQNVQLRGLTLEDGADLTKKLHATTT